MNLVSLRVLRAVLIVHTIALLAQAGLAGEFLSGTDAIVKFHEITGQAAMGLCLIQIVLAAIALRSKLVSLWLFLGSILIFLGEALQVGSGYGRFLRVHIPLGVILFAAVSWQTIAVFRRPAESK